MGQISIEILDIYKLPGYPFRPHVCGDPGPPNSPPFPRLRTNKAVADPYGWV